jgi:tetratricopeptide (TPR) repeat protein
MRIYTLLFCVFALFLMNLSILKAQYSLPIDSLMNAGQLTEAAEWLDQKLQEEPKNADWLWRMSRNELLIGETKAEESEQKSHFERALEFANGAVKADKKNSMGYIRRAAANGKIALFQGVLTANTYVNEVRDDCERALKLKSADAYELAAAQYILGRTHLKLSETPAVLRMPLDLDWGNLEEALELLEKAVAARPQSLRYHFDYARALIEMEDTQAAKEILARIAELPETEPGDEGRRTEAAQMLAEL